MSASKQRGTAFESLIVPAYALAVPGTERRAANGAADRGDLNIPGETRFIAELKNCARFDLAGWYAEAARESVSAGTPAAVVIHKRKGKGQPLDQWVTCTVRDHLLIAHGWATE